MPERPPVVVIHAQGVVALLERLAVAVARLASSLERRFPPDG